MKGWMKNTVIMVIAATLVVGGATASSAGVDCTKLPDHPHCGDTPTEPEAPPAGTMCDPAEYPDGIFGPQTDDFSFTLGGKSDGTCIDVLTDEANPWYVTIEGSGARYLGVIPRDSIGPGDSCGGWLLRSQIYDYGPGNPLVLGYEGSVPAATINACGIEYSEWVDMDRWGVTTDQCVAGTIGDGDCIVADRLAVAHPLVLQVFLRGQDGKSTNFCVDLPPVGEGLCPPPIGG